MSANFTGRKAPNVSQYLANLNPSPNSGGDMPADFDIGSDLDFLTNAEFFDFDSFNGEVPGDFAAPSSTSQAPYPMDNFQYPNTGMLPSPSTMASPALQGQYPSQPGHNVAYPQALPNTGDKRKASTVATSPARDLEENSRMAAEEDKRRRNTAASARFRVKKKQREQALEKQAKDMTDKVQQLEGKVQQLEMENKWLKELITEKSDAKLFEAALSEKKKAAIGDERSRESRTDGVGTKPVVEA